VSAQLVFIVHNVRSCHNVGSIFRSADAFYVNKLILSGYTPYPRATNDKRLPHIASSADAKIDKTALGAQNTVAWAHEPDLGKVIAKLKTDGFMIAALEQTKASQAIHQFTPPAKLAMIVGREVEGIESEILALADRTLDIKMLGSKESLNVAVAAAIAMYQIRYGNGHGL
jgi:23S rRNA (guanosine2251-2'-O)-methyltransferase